MRLLVISPGFHGYYRAIARTFTHLGYDVDTHCYDAAASTRERAWNKLRHELPSHLRGSDTHQSADVASARALTAVRRARPDVLLVVRGDILTETFWEGAAATGARIGMWMYDEMRRTRFDAPLVSRYARIATYSALDARALAAAGTPALHVPLGFDHLTGVTPSSAGAGRVTFLGAPSAKRADALTALLHAGVPVRAWGRGWSDHPLDRARTWRLRRSGVPNARDVPGAEALGIMRGSAASLNIHGDQDGFTMRTFEAAGVGAVQLIDRADVAQYYEPAREVLVFDGHEHLIELCRRVLARPADFTALRERATARTLADHTLTHRARILTELW